MHILITGSSGFLGRHILDFIKKDESNFFTKITAVRSKDYNLEKFNDTCKMIKKNKPDFILHLAAYSGGILSNKSYPADYYQRNLLIINNMFFALRRNKYNLMKLFITIGGCSYPSSAVNPISEEDMWNGYPQKESAAYSIAKKTAIVASEAYSTQFGINSQILIPGNMYGEYDNFSETHSHIIPGIIHRMYKSLNQSEFYCWGDGSPIRDFVYAGDVAKIILKIIKKNINHKILNISNGKGYRIRNVVNIIKKELNYSGKLKWDISKPNGQSKKIFSTKKLDNLNIRCNTTLENGIKKTIKWFKKNYKTKKVRI